MKRRTHRDWVVSAATAAVLGPLYPSLAVSWNATVPADSAITATGLTDKPTLFSDENVVTNTAVSARGTGTYLGNGWVLTAQHVIQGTSGYGTLAPATSMQYTVSIGGISQVYTADATYVPSSADIALIHLTGTNSGPITEIPGVLESAIQTNTNENNTLVQLGGYGYYGPLAGTLSTDASFHRAFNVTTTGGSFMNVPAAGNSRLVNNNYVMGIGESGDSGSGLWMDTSSDSDTNLWDYNLIGALDTTSNTNQFGSNNQYSRVSSNAGWILSNAYASDATVTWDANSTTAGIQEGSGVWNLTNTNFGNGISNYAWDNSTTLNAYFGAHKGTAGTVTLGANITVQNMQFNPAVTGTYTIAGSGSYTLAVGATSVIATNADTTISATIAGGGGTLTKLGPNTLTLSGTNTFTGTLALGDGATSGNNGNGAVRIASSAALNGVTQVALIDNNSAYDVLQVDGTTSAGNISLASSVTYSWSGNTDGPAATAATMFENIGGNNTIAGAITGNSGGIGYGIAVDAGSIAFNTFTTSTTKTLYLRGPGNGSFSGVVSGSAVGITETGAGTWTFNNSNTYGGITTLAGGILSTNSLAIGGSSSGIGNSAKTATNLVLTGGTLRYTGAGATTDRLFTIGPAGGTLDGSGTGNLIFSNTGAIVSSDASTHAAATTSGSNLVTITAGGLTDLAVGMGVTGSGVTTGATITAINPDAGTITLSTPASAAGSPTLSFGAINRTFTLTGSTAAVNTLSAGLADSTGGGSLGLLKSGTGTWVLTSPANTFSGPTVISGGTLRLQGGAPVASYNFSSISGGTVTNSGIGTGMNATLNGSGGSLSTTGGPIAGTGALTLNGTGSTLDVHSPITDLSGTGTWSISLWVKTTQAGATLLNKGDGSHWTTGYSTYYLSSTSSGGSGTIPNAVRYAGGWVSGSSSAVTAPATWQMVTYTDNAGTKAIYVNGIASTLTQTGFTTADTGTMVRFGYAADPGDGAAALNGSLSDINIYGAALTAAQVQSLYTSNFASANVSNVLPNNTPVTLSTAGATLDAEGVNQNVGSLNGVTGSSVLLNFGSALNVTNVASSEDDGVITGKGSLNVLNPGTFTLGGANVFTGATTVGTGAQLNVSGTLSFTGAVVASGIVNFTGNHSSGLFVRTDGALTINNGGAINVAAAALQDNRTLLVTSGLTIAGTIGNWTGKLDLANNDLDVQGGSLQNISDEIKQGLQSATGIASSSAATDTSHLTTLGVILNTTNGSTPLYGSGMPLGTFDGTNPAAGDVLVKYTYIGDANLDGKVDASDYGRIDAGYLARSTGWYNGDFNYDGVVNGSDYTLIDNAFNLQSTALTDTIAAIATSQISPAATAVPEPAMISLLGLFSLSLRRRKHFKSH